MRPFARPTTSRICRVSKAGNDTDDDDILEANAYIEDNPMAEDDHDGNDEEQAEDEGLERFVPCSFRRQVWMN